MREGSLTAVEWGAVAFGYACLVTCLDPGSYILSTGSQAQVNSDLKITDFLVNRENILTKKKQAYSLCYLFLLYQDNEELRPFLHALRISNGMALMGQQTFPS